MPALLRGQENTYQIVNWFITLDAVSIDVYAIEFRVFDITSGTLPGTQIFPTTSGEYEDVTNSGKFSTGSYYAYDNTLGAGWTPALTLNTGTHRIEWRWRTSETADWQYGREDIEILSTGSTPTTDTYISVQDVRDAGLTDTEKYPDEDVLAAIVIWQTFIDRACRQWFNPRSYTFKLDGTDSDALHLGIPIISVEYLKINYEEEELDPDYYVVYDGRAYPDDRRNPRIKLKNNNRRPSIYKANYDGRIFRKGRQNQELKGVFGFIEENGEPPEMIKRALTKLVIEKLTQPIYGGDPLDAPPLVTGALLEEWTDGHKRKYAQAGGSIDSKKPGLNGITEDQEILTTIKMYRSPLAMAIPANESIR